MFYIIIKTRVKASEDKILSQKYITVKYVTIKYNKIYSIKNRVKVSEDKISGKKYNVDRTAFTFFSLNLAKEDTS